MLFLCPSSKAPPLPSSRKRPHCRAASTAPHCRAASKAPPIAEQHRKRPHCRAASTAPHCRAASTAGPLRRGIRLRGLFEHRARVSAASRSGPLPSGSAEAPGSLRRLAGFERRRDEERGPLFWWVARPETIANDAASRIAILGDDAEEWDRLLIPASCDLGKARVVLVHGSRTRHGSRIAKRSAWRCLAERDFGDDAKEWDRLSSPLFGDLERPASRWFMVRLRVMVRADVMVRARGARRSASGT